MKHFLTFFVAAVFALFQISCMTTTNSRGFDASTRVPPGSMAFDLTFEAMQFRVDPMRQVNTRKSPLSPSKVMDNPNMMESKFSGALTDYFGVYLGNGLFFDMNGNPWIDPVRLFDLQNAENYTFVEKKQGINGFDIFFERMGTVFTRRFSGPALMEQKTSVTPNGLVMTDNISGRSTTIPFSKDSDGFTSFGPIGVMTIRKIDPATITITGLPAASTFSRTDESTVDMTTPAGTIRIRKMSDHVEVAFSFFAGQLNKVYKLYRTAEGCLFLGDDAKGVEVLREGDKIIVYVNGIQEQEFEILKL